MLWINPLWVLTATCTPAVRTHTLVHPLRLREHGFITLGEVNVIEGW